MFLGIELGSTRIKAVVIDDNYNLVASGSHAWENKLKNGFWSYDLDEVWAGLQSAFNDLSKGCDVSKIKAMGVSAMMHGYLAFDEKDEQLAEFRTWRNTTTETAAAALTKAFNFNVPQRWSIAHLYQAVLNKEPHVGLIKNITTLAGYVHWKLTDSPVIGVGDASGMFPIDNEGKYDTDKVDIFDKLVDFNLLNILPEVKKAGEKGGFLTPRGAKLLDPRGKLKAGIPLCPPEGDAGTGMVATNSVKQRKGNISAGTSIFAMVVLEKMLTKVHTEIDIVTTPHGKHVAMVHCNNCCSDIDAWINLFDDVFKSFGQSITKDKLYEKLYALAAQGDTDCGGVLSYNYFSGEPITKFEEGRPLLVRRPDAAFNAANLMRSLIFSAIGTLKIGMGILESERVKVDELLGHGGFFNGFGQAAVSSALNVPVIVMDSAAEGGAWGIAILAAFMANKAESETLEEYLDNKVFANAKGSTVKPESKDVEGFTKYMKGYVNGLAVLREAVNIKEDKHETTN